ncbi:T1SS secreted agglutinin RTX [Pseudomonas chlororaphis subsp. aurantiaca]|nr:T1SS secreted agglutinin RTX [Pseudomonas chlororaphis subsp. aurantiaca]
MSLGAQAGTVTEDAATTASPTDSHSATGTIAFNDVDLSDTHTASFVAAPGNATALGNFALASVIEAANAANGTVNWTYTLNNAAAQALAQGQTVSETYVVTISDGHGSSTTQNVTITITGTNDQVQITSGVQSGDAKEDSGDYAASGNITFTDADLIDSHSVTVTPGASGYLGSFTTDPLNDSTGTGSGSLGWHFAVDNTALQFLGEGQTVTQTYNVAIGDGTVQTVTITLTGTNDRPTLTIADTTGAMSEGNAAATLSDSGALSFADLDSTDVVTVSHTANGNIAWSGGTLDADVASALVAGFSVDQNSWDYSSSQNLDFLGAGETITFSYRVVATDNSGAANAASATQTVSITITGSNDAPVLSFATGNDAGAVQEDTTLSVSGQFSSADIDHDASAIWSINGSPTGTYGSMAVDSTGQWTYTLANGSDGVASAVQSLKAGESHDEVFSVQVSDGLGGVDTQLVSVTVTGSNDAPVLSFTSGGDAGAVKEDTTLSVSGQFNSTDIDHDATATWSIVGANTGSFGSIAVDSTGQWTYTLANGTDGVASAVQSLKAGESHDEVFSVQVSDGLGGVDTQLVTVTVTGSNDQPTLTIADTAGAMNEGDSTATLSDSGALSFADVDNTDMVTVSHTANGDIAWSGGTLNAGVASALVAGFSVDQNSWDYSSNQNLDFLGSGETITFSYTVVATDDSGAANAASATQTVTITLTGTNDQPTLTIADTTGTMNEGNGTATLSDSGALSFADLDSTDAVTVSHTANGNIAWSGGTLDAGVASALVAGFSVDQNSWDYSSSQNLDFLGSGETITFSYTVVATDDSGAANAASATQTVTITLTGTNDQPTLTIADTTGTMNEGNGTATLSDSGALSFADLDSTDAVTVSHTANGNIAWSGGTLDAGVASALIAGFSVDQNSWDYSSSQNLDFLGSGETITFSYTVVATDDSGAANAASATQTVSITITGSNDTPMISFASSNDVGAVQEDTILSISGQFSSADIDHDATATWTINGSPTGTYGSIAVDSTGQWTYTLANGTDGVASAVQSLKAGESHDEVFSVQVSDGLGGVDTQLVTVTVTGSNDAPVLSFASGNAAGAVQEDTTLSVSGQFSSADIDHDATATWSIAGSNTGAFGSIAVDSTGQWTYTLANGSDGVASAVQSLKAGESHDEVFSVQISDGLGGVDTQLVTVTVTGSNDAPVLSFASGNAAGTVKEDTTLSVSGQFSSTDIDHAATASWSINGSPTGTYGSITVDSTGQWTYTLANGSDGVASAVQSLKAGESHDEVFSVQVSDGLGGVDTQLVTITVTGSNDAPVLNFATGNDAGAVQEDTTLSVSGQFSSADIDHDATATWSIAGSNTGAFGSIAVDSTGQWTYTLANGTDGVASAVQSLKAGESHDEVFSVQVSDGLGGVDTQQVTVTVTGTNDAAVLSAGIANLTETNAAVDISTAGTLTISDVDSAATFVAQTNTAGNYGKFSIGTGGAWTYTADSAHNEFAAGTTYTDTFAVSSADGTLTSVTVHIAGSNDSPTITSNGGGTTASVSLAENTTAVTTVVATDVDLPTQTLSYSIVGGADAAKFSIVSSTGALSFISAPTLKHRLIRERTMSMT